MTSKVYPSYLHMQIKYKSITVYIKKKRGEGGRGGVGAYIIVSKGTSHFKYVFKEETKQRQTKKDNIKEEGHLNYTTVIKNAFCFLVCLFFIR